ncbi:MAG: betaine/proline/choline family ABC transporter ATP-binding protein [Candidatus Izemoplasma sp.]|nr:betaine/proline/choline family ABC transporter ATP-binding protein [Candidatus Izemoplasma sp.]
MKKVKRKNKIEVENLQLIFGKGKAKQKAIKMIEDGASNEEIREETGCAVGIRNIDLNIKEGELFVIVGLSGSGKSSFLRCFNKLNNPNRGEIRIDGENILSYDKEQLRKLRRNQIGMVFQHFGLLSHRTILDNVAYGLEVQGLDEETRQEKAYEANKIVGLEGWEDYYPHQLSGGMKQRVGLARAIATEPEILLMDEPYSALDPLIRRDMQNELLNLEEYIDKTIIFITHDMNEAFKMGDRIALLKDGEIVQMGKPMSFFDDPKNDYVKDFIADVDKGQVLKAKQVMDDAEIDFKEDDDRNVVLKTLERENLQIGFVVDDENKLVGRISLEDVKKSRAKTIKSLIETDIQSFYRQRFIKEILPLVGETEYSVPIVDSKNRLRGTINKEVIINALI